jgi:hypothetical protein
MNDVTTQGKRLSVNNVNVALFGSHIKPFAAHRKMNACYTVEEMVAVTNGQNWVK